MGDALDFGCGVGRLVLPLARRYRTVVGIDISDAYIAEAVRNRDKHGLTNISLRGRSGRVRGLRSTGSSIWCIAASSSITYPGRAENRSSMICSRSCGRMASWPSRCCIGGMPEKRGGPSAGRVGISCRYIGLSISAGGVRLSSL